MYSSSILHSLPLRYNALETLSCSDAEYRIEGGGPCNASSRSTSASAVSPHHTCNPNDPTSASAVSPHHTCNPNDSTSASAVSPHHTCNPNVSFAITVVCNTECSADYDFGECVKRLVIVHRPPGVGRRTAPQKAFCRALHQAP